jgi:WD40 repeat protein
MDRLREWFFIVVVSVPISVGLWKVSQSREPATGSRMSDAELENVRPSRGVSVSKLIVLNERRQLITNLRGCTFGGESLQIHELSGRTEPGFLDLSVDFIYALAPAHDESHVLVAASDGRAVWVSLQSSEMTTLWRCPHQDQIHSATVSHRPMRAILGMDSGNVIVCDPTGENPTIGWKAHAGSIADLQVSPDGTELLTVSHDQTLAVWNLSNLREVTRLKCVNHPLMLGRWIPNQRRVLTTGILDDTIRLWDLATGEQSTFLSPSPLPIQALAVNSRGTLLAVGGMEKIITLWDLATGARLGEMSGHEHAISQLQFSQDSETLISGGRDGLIFVWETNTCRPLKRIECRHQFETI